MSIPNRPVTVVALTLWAIGSVVLAYAGNGVAAKRPTANQARTAERLRPPKELEALALKAIATQHNLLLADLEIDNSWIFTYEYTGQRANVYSVTDNHSDKAYQIAFDDNGHVLDLAKLGADDLATKAARYGKLSPYLFEYLKQAPPDEEIGVSIYLNLGPDTADQPKDDPPMDSEKLKGMSAQERQDYDQKALDFERRSKAYNAARAQRVADPVVQRLKEMGYHADVLGNTGFISLKLRPAMIKEVETWREVREISSAPNDKPNSGSRSPKSPTATMLDVSRPLIGADVVENRGINGQNITIGQVEVGGRVLNAAGGNNPYLAGLSQDNGFICANPSEHSVAVAGVMYSQATLPPVFRGISPGVHFLASGSCSGDVVQLDQSTRNLVNLGAVAVNHSHNGSDTGTAVTSNDQLYDAYVFTDHVGQVMSAGNDAGTPAQGCFGSGTGNVDRPAKGYNVISVGNFDDNETVNWNFVAMNPCSSFVPPASDGGDRVKPEVVAPGTLIDTTLAQQHLGQWFGDRFSDNSAISGTSFSAPHVTGEAALIMSRAVTTFGLQSFPSRPQVTKAIILASAAHPFPGHDGVGGISAVWADDIMAGNFGGFGHARLACADLPFSLATISLQPNIATRVVICWNTDPNYANYFTRPSADLGLRVRDPSGAMVGLADTASNTFEVLDFTPTVGGVYSIIVRSRRCDEDPGIVAWAF